MRLIWIAVILILVGVVGYSYDKDSADCMKILRDSGDLFLSLLPVTVELKGSTATISPNSNDSAAPSASSPPRPHVIDPDAVTSVANAPPVTASVAPSVTNVPVTANLTANGATTNAVPPASSVPVSNAAGLIPSLVDGKLIAAGGGAYAFPSGSSLSSIRYYAIYYTAAWNSSYPSFTSELVQWYNGFKPAHPEFELIFVSEDHDENSQLGYMKQMNMPWPAVRFGELKHDGNGTFKGSGIEQFAGTAIPDLVLVDPNGKVLLDSYQNGAYVGPEQVMNGMAKAVAP